MNPFSTYQDNVLDTEVSHKSEADEEKLSEIDQLRQEIDLLKNDSANNQQFQEIIAQNLI